MAGMYDPFALTPLDWLRNKVQYDFHTACLQIDGQMGKLYVGGDEYWVDYDEGILY